MKRLLLLGLLSALTLLGQRAETVIYRAVMLPSNENPPIDINANGSAVIRAHVVRNTAGEVISGTVDFIVNYTFPGQAEFTGLHIHRGDAGVNGPVVINTGIGGAAGNIVDATGRGNITRSAQVTPADTTALSALRDLLVNPAGFYVNLHTTVNPGGVIRGQLMKPEIITLMTPMLTSNEVPPITGQDASGMAAITVMRTRDDGGNVNSGLVLFDIDYAFDRQVTFSGLHIHSSPRGVNGPVIINTGVANLPSTATGRGSLNYAVEVNMAAAVQVATLNGLYNDPGSYYVNAHTTEFPGGVIRGQLRRTDENIFPGLMVPSNEVPAVTIDAMSVASLKVNSIRGAGGEVVAARVLFDSNYRFPGAVTFTGFHIHDGVAGVNGPVTVNTGISGTASVVSETGFGNVYIPVTVTAGAGLATVNSLLMSPEKHYLNMHSTVSPGGVVRVQVAEKFAQVPVIKSSYSTVIAQKAVAQGGWMSLFGDRLAYATTDYFAWEGLSVPQSLNGVEVTVGGRRAPILAVTPGRVDVQVPFDATEGTQQVVLKNAAGDSASLPVDIAKAAPAIWTVGANQGQVYKVIDQLALGGLVGADNPVQTADVIAIITTGMGQTTPALTTGALVPESMFSTVQTVTATLGGRTLIVAASLAFPGLPGIYGVGAVIPPGIPSGMQPLELTANGVKSNQVMVAVR